MSEKIEAVKSGGIVLKAIDSLSNVVYLNDRSRKLLKELIIPDYWKERFNKSLKLT